LAGTTESCSIDATITSRKTVAPMTIAGQSAPRAAMGTFATMSSAIQAMMTP
jgi:hypothetical protein